MAPKELSIFQNICQKVAYSKISKTQNSSKFKINEELGVLTWADEIDIAPETIDAEATRSQLPKWMHQQEADSAKMAL